MNKKSYTKSKPLVNKVCIQNDWIFSILLIFQLELTYIGCLPLHWPLGLHARIEVPYFSSYPVLHLFWLNNKLCKYITWFVRKNWKNPKSLEQWDVTKSTLFHTLNWIHWDIHCEQSIHSQELEVEGSLEQHTWNVSVDLVIIIWTILNMILC